MAVVLTHQWELPASVASAHPASALLQQAVQILQYGYNWFKKILNHGFYTRWLLILLCTHME